jgi:hypothetical protein
MAFDNREAQIIPEAGHSYLTKKAGKLQEIHIEQMAGYHYWLVREVYYDGREDVVEWVESSKYSVLEPITKKRE